MELTRIPNHFMYYDMLGAMKRVAYTDCLNPDNITSGFVHYEEMKSVDGKNEYDFWGYVLEKSKKKYLLQTIKRTADGDIQYDVDVRRLLPLKIAHNGTRKVSYRGVVYELIEKFISINITPKQTLTFRQLVDTLARLKHANPEHYKLNWFIELTQTFDRANFRISTPAGFGKDSTVDIRAGLLSDACTIENPTIAKLEERSYRMRKLALNEVVDITKENWRQIEQYLLAVGAHKNTVTKRSRAFGGVDETIDISTLSLSLMYNDIDHYAAADTYIDNVSKGAVLDRFMPLRLWGRFTEDFNSAKNVDVAKFAEENLDNYKNLVANLMYYRVNYQAQTKIFDDSKLVELPERWKMNTHRLLKLISCYVESQEEYDYWIGVINKAHEDYKAMLLYPAQLEKLKKRFTAEDLTRELKTLKTLPTFIERLSYIDNVLKGDRPIKEEAWSL